MKALLFFLFLSLFSWMEVKAETIESDKKDDKVIYKFKEYEKLDFDELDVGAENSGDGNLSITPREQIKFQNKLPLKRSFNREIKKSVDNIF